MKQALGFFIGLLALVLAALLVLRIWHIHFVSADAVLRGGATLAVVAGLLLVLLTLRFAFFANPAAGFDAARGRHAHPRAGAERP